MTTPPEAAALADELATFEPPLLATRVQIPVVLYGAILAALRAMPDAFAAPGKPISDAALAVDKLRTDLFAILRRHEVSEQCFAEVAMVTQALRAGPAGEVVDARKAYDAGWRTWQNLDRIETKTGRAFPPDYRCMAVVQDALRARPATEGDGLRAVSSWNEAILAAQCEAQAEMRALTKGYQKPGGKDYAAVFRVERAIAALAQPPADLTSLQKTQTSADRDAIEAAALERTAKKRRQLIREANRIVAENRGECPHGSTGPCSVCGDMG